MSIRGKIWTVTSQIYPTYLRKIYKMDIGKNVVLSYKANLDKSINPKGIHIGDNTWVLAGAFILAHDHCRDLKVDTYIGNNCIIGINSLIMPGVVIGNHVIIGGGSVVTKNIPSNCIAVGNPAKVIKTDILIDNNGQIVK